MRDCVRALIVGSVLIVSTACSSTSAVDWPVEVDVEIDRTAFSVGDSVVFNTAVHNPTDQRIQIGGKCGPSLDVQLRRPDGSRLSVLSSMVGDGGFTCELAEHHFADPGETERLTLRWKVEAPRGTYMAVAHTRCGKDQCPTSDPVAFVVN